MAAGCMNNPDKTANHLSFNKAASSSPADAKAASAPNTMALVIDIQDFARMDAADAQNYADKLAESLSSLRDRNIPVTWVTMRKDAQLYEPLDTDQDVLPQLRDVDTLQKMGFHGIDPEHENHGIFRAFLQEHGPRTNEAVSVKSVKSALVEHTDALGKPEYEKTLEDECKEPLSEYFGSQEKTLAEYMKEQGIQNTVLMGAVSSHCVSETAVSAAIKGFNPQIVTDLVLSWHGDQDELGETPLLLWHGTANDGVAFDAYHQENINTKLSKIASEDRGFTPDNRAAISNIEFTTSAALLQKPTSSCPDNRTVITPPCSI